MAAGESDLIFETKLKHKGIFTFKEFYKFSYDWLSEETGLDITETKYEETITEVKQIVVEWVGEKKVTDYFKFSVKITIKADPISDIEVVTDGIKIKTNKGKVEVGVKGSLVRDYDGEYSKSAFRKFLRAIYDKYIIVSRRKQFEDKLWGDLDEYMAQVKAYLALEGRK